MKESQVKDPEKRGAIEPVEPEAEPEKAPASNTEGLDQFLTVLLAMRRPKRSVTTAPTFKPQNLADQIQFYDDGAVRRLYVFVNKTWRYTTLT